MLSEISCRISVKIKGIDCRSKAYSYQATSVGVFKRCGRTTTLWTIQFLSGDTHGIPVSRSRSFQRYSGSLGILFPDGP